MRNVTLLLLAAAMVLTVSACSGTDVAEEAQTALPGEPAAGDAQTTDSGLKYYVIADGDGNIPAAGTPVNVHYTGYLMDGTKFDSSVDRGAPFTFQLGAGEVIKGWDEGVALMSPGAKYKFVIPPELGYGSSGTGSIPGDATLVFDVEMLPAQ